MRRLQTLGKPTIWLPLGLTIGLISGISPLVNFQLFLLEALLHPSDSASLNSTGMHPISSTTSRDGISSSVPVEMQSDLLPKICLRTLVRMLLWSAPVRSPFRLTPSKVTVHLPARSSSSHSKHHIFIQAGICSRRFGSKVAHLKHLCTWIPSPAARQHS